MKPLFSDAKARELLLSRVSGDFATFGRLDQEVVFDSIRHQEGFPLNPISSQSLPSLISLPGDIHLSVPSGSLVWSREGSSSREVISGLRSHRERSFLGSCDPQQGFPRTPGTQATRLDQAQTKPKSRRTKKARCTS